MDVTNPKGLDETRKIFENLKDSLKQDTVKMIFGNKIDIKKRAIQELQG